jgi:hypothetical protein
MWAPIIHETYLGDLGIYEGIILRWIFNIMDLLLEQDFRVPKIGNNF